MGSTAKRPRKVKLKYMGRIRDKVNKGKRKRARRMRQFMSYPQSPNSKYMKTLRDSIDKSKEEGMFDKPLTIEMLEEHLKDLELSRPKSEYIMYQGCKTHGLVKRTSSNMNLCDDPTCPSCSEFNKALKDYAKTLSKDT